jgi:hypothetical protein
MDDETRLAALEARLRAVEDELAIFRLLNAYGPLVDSASGEAAAEIWIAGGGYEFGLGGTSTVARSTAGRSFARPPAGVSPGDAIACWTDRRSRARSCAIRRRRERDVSTTPCQPHHLDERGI